MKAIFRREEIFKGKHAETAPDILMEPAETYSLTHAKTALEDADWISGDHRPEGVIVAAGPHVKPFEQPPMLIDLAPTILAALDAPASIKHTGRVLHEVVGTADVSQRADVQGQPAFSGWAAARRAPSATPRPTRWRSTSAVSATSSSPLRPDGHRARRRRAPFSYGPRSWHTGGGPWGGPVVPLGQVPHVGS